MEKHIFSNTEEVAEHFAKYLLNVSTGKTEFHIALSGGSTPKALFDFIAQNFANKFDWDSIHLWWGDERCVAPDDAESNFKMTYDRLISKIDIPESNVHRVLGENNPDQEAMRYSKDILENLTSENGLPKFDLIILGMGPDGHTASIFPHQMKLLLQEQVCAVATHPESGQKRITLTGNVINNASEVAFLVTGGNKTDKVRSIFDKGLNHELYPAYHIKPTHGKLVWFLDEAAWGNS
ncbi:MAG: 6-phosphogluconolactonase [Cyclobacteriaceae bacterium]